MATWLAGVAQDPDTGTANPSCTVRRIRDALLGIGPVRCGLAFRAAPWPLGCDDVVCLGADVDFPAGPRDRVRMASRLRRGDASGPAEWLLAFLQARDHPPRARAGSAAGPTEWLLVFLGAAAPA